MEANSERTEKSEARNSGVRGADILLDVLRSEGIRYIFGNPGTTELPLIDALVTKPDIRYVWGLQEATAVSMADGYAQASGMPAFVNLHTAGGLGHGMGAIMKNRNRPSGRCRLAPRSGRRCRGPFGHVDIAAHRCAGLRKTEGRAR